MYQVLTDSIKWLEERKDSKGKDTFDLSDWWWLVEVKLCNATGIRVRVACRLNNSPNSCPSESLFTIFNVTYNDDQKLSHTDYIDLSGDAVAV
jgi:hypothetical protein